MRTALAILLSFPALAGAAPLSDGAPRLQLRLEALGGQPTTLLGGRGGGAFGLAYRLSDQIWLVGDAGTRAAPNGGAFSMGAGLQATFDITPIEPYIEVLIVDFPNKDALGYSLATRTGLGADYKFASGWRVGLVVRTYAAFDPVDNDSALAGYEAALRFSFMPGER